MVIYDEIESNYPTECRSLKRVKTYLINTMPEIVAKCLGVY